MVHKEMAGQDPQLIATASTQDIISRFNDSFVRLYDAEDELRPILGSIGEHVKVVPPLNIDYGVNTFIGDGVHINVATTIHDGRRVRIGQRTLTGPYLEISTGADNSSGEVTIGDDVWIGGGVKVRSGSHIGNGSVVAAGSVVEGSIPDNSLVVGFPARVIRSLDPNQPSRYDDLKQELGRERMVDGSTFYTSAPDLVKDKQRAYELFSRLNQRKGIVDDSTAELIEAFKKIGKGLKIKLPFYWSFGYQIEIGDGVEMGAGIFLGDGGLIKLGDGVKMGDRVQIYTTNHLPEKSERAFIETKSVSIGKDVQIGDDVIILPGVSIGDYAIVAAGSVVKDNVLPRVRVAGLPAKPIQ